MLRTESNLDLQLRAHLERKCTSQEDPWQIKKSSISELGIIATRDINPGEIIFIDPPLFTGPRISQQHVNCINCLEPAFMNCLKCNLPLCKTCGAHPECSIIQNWTKKAEPDRNLLFKCLTPIRALLLSQEEKELIMLLKAHKDEKHFQSVNFLKDHFELSEEEEEFLRTVCAVLDANAFELTVQTKSAEVSLRGLYPLAALANHSCTPNVSHVFDSDKRMVLRAAVFIPKGSEIVHSYTRILWSTPSRTYHLWRSKHFICKCVRCLDRTEFGSYLSAVLCTECKGYVLPLIPYKLNTNWQCEKCEKLYHAHEVGRLLSLLGSVLNSFQDGDVLTMLKFLDQKLLTLVPSSNLTVVEIKFKLIWILGYSKGFLWKELPEDLLGRKNMFCREILDIMKLLQLGMCKMRGLLLYEMWKSAQELRKRKDVEDEVNDLRTWLHEAAKILKDDHTAPKEVKEYKSNALL